MKRIILLGCMLIAVFACKAQYKNDKWLVGVYPLLFEFKKDSTVNDSVYINKGVFYRQAHSNINDSSGVLFSCDGYNIYDSIGDIMENGQKILPNKITTVYVNQMFQQSIILPKKDGQYYVFSWGLSDKLFDSIANNLTTWRYDILTYSIVDLSYNNGKGKVISKENYLLQDANLSACQMSATRHANGRDWWLIKPHNTKHLFYTFLVTPEGITQQPIQEFESPTFTNGVLGQSNFSPDGSLYVMTSEFNNHITQVNTFDRCSGKMTRYKTIPWKYDTTLNSWLNIGGACFSPNNQFVYLINNLSILQYDLQTDERIELNKDSVFSSTGNTIAYNSSDGKIYIGNFHKTKNAMSYIENPNLKGVGSHYCIHCYQTKNINTAAPPNNPNYELGALVGSACDTIGKLNSSEVVIFPNPVTDESIISVPLPANTAVELVLYNALGEVILTQKKTLNTKQQTTLSVKHLSKGVYLIKIIGGNQQWVKKVTK